MKITLNKNGPNADTDVDHLAYEYGVLKKIGDATETNLKSVRSFLLDKMKVGDTAGKDGVNVSLNIRKKAKIDTALALALFKRKGIPHFVSYEVTPKSDIPDDILDILDQYFVIKEVLDIDKKGVEKMHSNSLISNKQLDLIITYEEIPTVTVKVEDTVMGEIIEKA